MTHLTRYKNRPDDGDVKTTLKPKELAQQLHDLVEMDKEVGKKIWSFGPNGSGPNIVTDSTKGVQYVNEIKVCIY